MDMNKKLLIVLITGYLLGCTITQSIFAQSKETAAKDILYQLSTSAQLVKKKWTYSFSENQCEFIKARHYIEQDGTFSSSQEVIIPLSKVHIEKETKTYDTFFQCKKGKSCITRVWKNSERKISRKNMINSESFFIRNPKLSSYIYKMFFYLQELCDRSYYPGPAGLTWGEGYEKVREKLSNRFVLKSEGISRDEITYSQIYAGTFSKLPAKKIRANFFKGQFYEMQVDIPTKSVASTWLDIVKKIKEKYGAPNTLTLPGAVKSLENFKDQGAFRDFSVFDLEVKEQHWKPEASWKYKNGAVIQVLVLPGKDDWTVQWKFFDAGMKKKVKKTIRTRPVDDF